MAVNQLHLNFGQYAQRAKPHLRRRQQIGVFLRADFHRLTGSVYQANTANFCRQTWQCAPCAMRRRAGGTGQTLHVNIAEIAKGETFLSQLRRQIFQPCAGTQPRGLRGDIDFPDRVKLIELYDSAITRHEAGPTMARPDRPHTALGLANNIGQSGSVIRHDNLGFLRRQ